MGHKSKTLLHVVGARPNVIKLGPLWHELAQVDGLRQLILHTGQHYDAAMSAELFEDFRLPAPAVNLDTGRHQPAHQFAAIVQGVTEAIGQFQPDYVMTYGDVRSTAAAAIATYYCGARGIHYEAGQRAFTRSLPEEMNRITTDVFSDILLAAEPQAADNLALFRIPDLDIHVVGSLMCDAARMTGERLAPGAMPRHYGLPSRYALVTCHRQETVDARASLETVVGILRDVSDQIPLAFCIHPRTEMRLKEFGLLDTLRRSAAITLLPSLRYAEFAGLLRDATLILSDSGGLVAESTYFRIPHVYLRDRSEHALARDAGGLVCVGLNAELAAREAARVLAAPPAITCPVWWDGRSAQRIRQVVCDKLGLSTV